MTETKGAGNSFVTPPVLLCAAYRVVLAVVTLCLAGTVANAQSGPLMARASSVTGRVILTFAGGAPAFPLTAGYTLNPADRIDTRGGGRVVIELSDGSVVIVQPETVLMIRDFRAANSLRELFEITVGLVRVKINHFAGKPNPYRMNSPTASIAVRGTEFNVGVNDRSETNVDVFEGAVEVRSLSDPERGALIEAGNGVFVPVGQEFRFYTVQAGLARSAPGGPGDRDRRSGPERGGDVASSRPPARAEAERTPQQRAATNPGHGPPPVQAAPAPPSPSHPEAMSQPPRDVAGPERLADENHGEPGVQNQNSPRNTASTYDRYIASLTEVGHLPFLYRFNAYSESHLDSLENPAYAAAFRSTEGRLTFIPSINGVNGLLERSSTPGIVTPTSYNLSPQLSMFSPVAEGRVVVGASFTLSRVGSGSSSPLTGVDGTSSYGRFSSAAFVIAGKVGEATAAGLSMERHRGTGSETGLGISEISQQRFTAGITHDFSARHKLGLYYRYGALNASNLQDSNSTFSSGHSNEIGLRLRGAITPRLLYGISAAWLGVSLTDRLTRVAVPQSSRDNGFRRGVGAVGIGYLLDRKTTLTFDVSAGASSIHAAERANMAGAVFETSGGTDRALSVHAAVQRDFTRRLFGSVSILRIARASESATITYPDVSGRLIPAQDVYLPFSNTLYPTGGSFSDLGVGWRFSPSLSLQYLFCSDYGVSRGSQVLMFRYTFRPRGE